MVFNGATMRPDDNTKIRNFGITKYYVATLNKKFTPLYI